MWTDRRRKKLQKAAKDHDAVIVLGCDTANETVREAVASTGAKVIEGMRVGGLMNAKMSFRLPGNVAFKDCRIIPISQRA
jgi:basic membrane lipoprotein Med (substrate-binding protein (PBP1-ABC) superfamily)